MQQSRLGFSNLAGLAVCLLTAATLATPGIADTRPDAERTVNAAVKGAWELPDDSRPWIDRVAVELRTQDGTPADVLDVIVSFRQPPQLEQLTRKDAGHPERLAWIRHTGEALSLDHEEAGVHVVETYSHIPAMWARASRELMRTLASDPRVDFIEPLITFHAHRVEGNALINATPLHDMGVTGAGIGVAILDTGVDYRHDELAPGGTDPDESKTIKLWDAVNHNEDPMDDQGHGTAVAGIAGGSVLGVAPGSRVVGVKVLNQQGSSVGSSVLSGLNAVILSVSGGNPYNIRVVNMSLGGYADSNLGEDGLPPQPCDQYSTTRASETLTDMGVLVISSAGNGGCVTGVGHPACGSAVMAVGAVFDEAYNRDKHPSYPSFGASQCQPHGCSSADSATDVITCYSDSGAQLDVWAPSHFADTTNRVTGTNTNPIRMGFGGTSAAAPYVAGAAALLFEAFPNASPEQIRLALTATGQPITDSRNDITRNRIDLLQAWQFLADDTCPLPASPLNVNVNKESVCRDEPFRLRWGWVDGAESYQVQRGIDASFSNPVVFEVTSGTELVHHITQGYGGTFRFRVRAVTGDGCNLPSTWSDTVVVNYTHICSEPIRHLEEIVTGVAQWPGFEPAFWHSDLAVANPGDNDAQVRLTFLGQGPPRSEEVVVPAGQQRSWERLLGSLFGLNDDDVGTIRLESDQPVAVQSRTYSQEQPGDATFGQNYPGVALDHALADGQVGVLPYLRSDDPFYTNIELVNVGSVTATAEVRLLADDGSELHSFSRTIASGARTAVNRYRALPSGHPSAFAEVRLMTPGARLVAFASVVDDESKDPTTVPMTVAGGECPAGGCRAVVTGVAQWPGFEPAFWHSDLGLANAGEADAHVTITFLGQEEARVEQVTIPAGQQRSWERILLSLFELPGNDVGTLRLESNLPLAVQSRTYSQVEPGDPTFGQNYPAVDLRHALTEGQIGVLPYLRSDPPFYTNLELVNVGDPALNTEVRVFDNTGTQIRRLTRNLSPGDRVAVNRQNLLPGEYPAAFALIRVLTPDGRLAAFASVVDDVSKDPTTVPVVIYQP